MVTPSAQMKQVFFVGLMLVGVVIRSEKFRPWAGTSSSVPFR
jgi:hypothetical protein